MADQSSPGFIQQTCQRIMKIDESKYLNITIYIKNFVSELIGTAVLLFFGCMCVQARPDDHFGVSLSFGLAAFVAIEICCHNSGGFINPAVTIVGYFFHKVSLPMAVNYIVAECIGAVLGYRLLMALTPPTATASCLTTVQGLNLFQAVVFEAIMTGILMLLVCSMWDPRNDAFDSATLKLGFAIFALGYAGDGYTGCSMNPARSFGPALWHGKWENQWVYWLGPLTGATLSALTYRKFFCGRLQPYIRPGDKLEL